MSYPLKVEAFPLEKNPYSQKVVYCRDARNTFGQYSIRYIRFERPVPSFELDLPKKLE